MKLALCIFNYFPYGGMQRDFLRVALLLARQYSVEVLTTVWEGKVPESLSVNRLAVTGLTNHRRMRNFAKKALQQARQLNCQLIVGFNKMPGLDIYFAADNCYVAAVEEKHGLFCRLTPRYRVYKALEKSVFAGNKKTKILVLAARQKKAYQRIYHTADERFYQLPVEFNRLNHHLGNKTFAQKIRLAQDSYSVLMVCSAFKTKGVDRTLAALGKLEYSLLSKIQLLIIGSNRTEGWLNLAKRLKVDAHVQFLGEKQNVLEYMCAADLFLHPARQEAGGKVILEAMSCGLPILTTAECGYAEHVMKADAGILLPQKNIDRFLPEALKSMLMDDGKRADWRKNALDYVAHYPVTDLAAEAVQIIQNTVNNDGKNS